MKKNLVIAILFGLLALATTVGIIGAQTPQAINQTPPADATDPTSGGGAATGRIPVKIGGSTVYLPYY